MNAKNLSVAAAALVLCIAQAHADAFESEIAEISRTVAAAAPKTIFAKSIVCEGTKASGLTGSLRFYTRLEGVESVKSLSERFSATVWTGVSPKSDETAAGLNDYRSASISAKSFDYYAWSCDTTDYAFSFDTSAVLRSGGETSRPIKARVRIETRGQLDYAGELDCTALF